MSQAYALPAPHPDGMAAFYPGSFRGDLPGTDRSLACSLAASAKRFQRLLASMFSLPPSVYRLVKDLTPSLDVWHRNAPAQQERYDRAVAYFRHLARLSISRRTGEPLHRRQACITAIETVSHLDTTSLSYLYSQLGISHRSDAALLSRPQQNFAKLLPAWQYRRIVVSEKREGRPGIAAEMYHYARESGVRSLDRLIQTYDEVSSARAETSEHILRAAIRMAGSVRSGDKSLFFRLELTAQDHVDLEEHFLRPLTADHPETAFQIFDSLPARAQTELAAQHHEYRDLLDRYLLKNWNKYVSLGANGLAMNAPLHSPIRKKAEILDRLSCTPRGLEIALTLTARETDDRLCELINLTTSRAFHDALRSHEPFVRRVLQRADRLLSEHVREGWTYQDFFLSLYPENGASDLETTQRILRQVVFSRMSYAEQRFYGESLQLLPLLPDPENYTHLLKPRLNRSAVSETKLAA